jgi:hypothetical protein
MLILDAYNVLHHAHLLPAGHAKVSAVGMGRLIDQAGIHAGRIVVVCDGAPKPHERTDDPGPRAEVIHAGPGREADDVIERLIEQEANPRDMIVVSSDRRLKQAGRRRGATVMDSDEFVRRLAERLRSSDVGSESDTAEKPEVVDVKRWMKEFGFGP